MNYRNPQYNHFGTVDCEIEHPTYGWMPFTASSDDPEEHGRELYARILQEGNIAPAPYRAPDADLQEWRAYFAVSAFQAQAALTIAGYMDEIEKILKDPMTDPFIVLAWNKAQIFERVSPNIIDLAQLLGITDEQLDDLFKFAATIKA